MVMVNNRLSAGTTTNGNSLCTKELSIDYSHCPHGQQQTGTNDPVIMANQTNLHHFQPAFSYNLGNNPNMYISQGQNLGITSHQVLTTNVHGFVRPHNFIDSPSLLIFHSPSFGATSQVQKGYGSSSRRHITTSHEHLHLEQ